MEEKEIKKAKEKMKRYKKLYLNRVDDLTLYSKSRVFVLLDILEQVIENHKEKSAIEILLKNIEQILKG